MSLLPGPNTFTKEELLDVWRTFPVKISRYGYLQYVKGNFEKTYTKTAELICLDLFAAASDPVNHLALLDESFGSMYQDMYPERYSSVSEESVGLFGFFCSKFNYCISNSELRKSNSITYN